MESESQKVVLEKTNRIDKILAILIKKIKRPKYQYCKCTNGPYPTTNKHFSNENFVIIFMPINLKIQMQRENF